MNYLNKMLLPLFILFSLAAISHAEPVSATESNDADRILMLEKALAPNSPEQTALLFAKANKERNGAVQFMLFSDALKNKFKNSWPSWVSGTSSPWITAFKIKKTTSTKNSIHFEIIYQWATASGPFTPPLEQKIIIEPVPKNITSSQKWWITKFDDNQ